MIEKIFISTYKLLAIEWDGYVGSQAGIKVNQNQFKRTQRVVYVNLNGIFLSFIFFFYIHLNMDFAIYSWGFTELLNKRKFTGFHCDVMVMAMQLQTSFSCIA